MSETATTSPARLPARSVEEVSARLTAARQEYLKALALRSEALRLKATLEPNNPDGSAALHTANQRVSVASRRFERALQDFISFASVRRQSV